jgi:hypothetical protein
VARTFNGTSEYLSAASAVVAGTPCSMAAWFKPVNLTNDRTVMGVSASGSSSSRRMLCYQNKVQAYEADGTAVGTALSAINATAAVWNHGAVVFASASSRAAYLNGANKGTDTTTTAISGIDSTTIGCINYNASASEFFGGDVAEAAIWNVALSDVDVAVLAAGISPLLVRPDALVAYWPLLSGYSPEIDLMVGRRSMTVTGTTLAAHPRLYLPTGPLAIPTIALHAAQFAAASSCGVSTTAALALQAPLAAASSFRVSTTAIFNAAAFAATSGIGVSTSAALTATARFAAASSFGLSTAALFAAVRFSAASGLRVSTTASLTTGVEALHASRISLLLAGVEARVRVSGLTIHDVLNDAPNTCSLTIDGSETPVGQQSLRVSLNLDQPQLLFNGALQEVGLSYEGQAGQLVWPASAIDDTPRANRRRPFGTWTTVSATTVVQYLMALFAPGFTVHVQLGLPAVSIILDGSEGMNGAFKQITDLIGGWFFWEDGALWLFNDPAFLTSALPDTIDDTPGRFLDDPPIHASVDDSQLRTRSFGKGHGEALLADVLANESILPVANAAAWFGTVTPGGKAIAVSQILAYTGVQLGGNGSLVGPGAGPTAPPGVAAVAGAGLPDGVYQYACTDVTAAGESLPSPLASATAGTVASGHLDNPVAAPTVSTITSSTGGLGDGAWYFAVAFKNAVGVTGCGPSGYYLGFSYGTYGAALANIPIGPAGTTGKTVYGWDSTHSLLYKCDIGNATTTIADYAASMSLIGSGGALPSTNSTGTSTAMNQIAVAGIGIGNTGTTSRKVYRTAVNGSQLKLLATIANNTATTLGANDTTADGSLGANAPTADTSGLSGSSVAGNVLAGSTSLLTSGAGPFHSGGGWGIVKQNLVRYTGITGNTLTGIPATGPGALLTTVLYGDQILPAPALTGVTGNALPILNGTPVNIWVQRDDLSAQADQAAIDLANGVTPADGIYEAAPITDQRRGEASLIALCDATLARYSRPLVTVTYACRDVKTKSGRPVTINLASPPIHQTLTIQDVTIDQIDSAPGLLPRFAVTASNVRQSLDGILRQLLAAAS